MGKQKIIIVEDERIPAEDLRIRLENLGYIVTGIASSGDKAIQSISENPPDLALMDIRIKGEMNGIETAAILRDKFNVPVIYLTAYADQDTLEQVKQTQPYGFILKPFEDTELQGVIETALYRFNMEKKLKESEERFRSLYENTTIGLYRTTPDGKIIMANPSLISMLGYKDLVELDSINLEEEGYENLETRKNYKTLMEKYNQVNGLESSWIKKDRSVIYVRESAHSIRDTEGNILFYEGTVENITDKKINEEKYLTIFKSATEGILFINDKGIVEAVNAAFTKITEIAPEKVINRHSIELAREFVNPKDISWMLRRIKDLLTFKPIPSYELNFRGKVLEISSRREMHRKGVTTFFRDITLKKQAENVLKHRIEMEQFVKDISMKFININFKEFDTSINQILKKICHFVHVERCYIFQFSDNMKVMTNTFGWNKRGTSPKLPSYQKMPTTSFTWWMNKIHNQEIVYIPNLDDLPDEAQTEKKIFQIQNVQSLLVVPLIQNKKSIGFIGFDSISLEKVWSKEDINLLQTIGNLFISVLEKKKVEENLKKSEAFFRDVIENATGIPYRLIFGDKIGDGKYDFMGEGIKSILGLQPEEISEKRFHKQILEVIPLYPNIPSDPVQCREAMLKGEIPVYRAELRLKTSKGEKWVSDRSLPLFDENEEKIIGAFGILFDITDRKKAEAIVHVKEEKYRKLFETIAQGVVYQDSMGLIIDANPAAERILGLSLNQMQGRTSMDPRWKAVHEDGSDFPGETHPAMVALKTGKRINDVIMGVINSQQNGTRWIKVNAVPQFKEGRKKPYQVYATFEDVTEMEKILKEKELLIREIHHRVKNNFATISSLLSLQSGQTQEPRIKEILNVSKNRILSMARIHEKLYKTKDVANVDLPEYIKSTTDELIKSYDVDTSKIYFNLNIDKSTLNIGQAIHCGLIINELVSNAIKHAFPELKKHKGKISVSLKIGTDNDITLIIKDNGIGLNRDFDIESSDSLGLKLVKILAEKQLEGDLKIIRNKGAEFQITFKSN